MIIALVAGEASGDQLGSSLIRAIRADRPDARFYGIGGPLMKAAGMECWWGIEQLSVMGLAEVVAHLPRLVRLRRLLVRRLLQLRPEVVIGIDSPDFNLGVERRLRAHAVPVIHYVSPTVWAWRPGRVKKIARSTDRVICLFPFEPGYYRQQAMEADYTGHPMADEIPLLLDAAAARAKLGIGASGSCIALLPGSRPAEVRKLTPPMLEAAALLAARPGGARFAMPAATAQIRDHFESALAAFPSVDCRVFLNQSRDVMAASDLVICASGTATLEAMLVNRPMVVCYRLAGLTFRLAKWLDLVKTRYFSLPNILAAEELVPELLQHEVSGQRIAAEACRWLDNPGRCDQLSRRFDALHRQLRMGAAAAAARVVLQHLEKRGQR